MPTIFELISHHFWILCLGMGAINYLRARKGLNSVDGERAIKASRYLKLSAIGINLPWLVMGLGSLMGRTPTVWYYFRPQDGNPYVIAWLAAVIAISGSYAWWVLFAGGVEKVREFQIMTLLGQSGSSLTPEWSIKLSAIIAALVPPVWIWLAISMNTPTPK